MFHHFKTLWLRSKSQPPGKRFQSLYAAYLGHNAEWFRMLLQYIALANLTLGAALSLTWEAEPEQIALALTLAAGLWATQTSALAWILDMLELLLRAPFRQPAHAVSEHFERTARPAALVITERLARLPPPA